MKNSKLLLIGLLFTSFAVKAQDKAFEKGKITIDLGAGVGLYGTKVHEEYNQKEYYWTGSGIGTRTKRIKHDTTDASGAFIFPLQVEYGITNWLGIGARFAYANWIEERDSITKIKPKATSIDAGLVLNFHLIKSRRFDMPISLSIGYSNFKFMANDANDGIAKDNGMFYGIGLVPRIYFGDHIGMFFNLGYAGYNYPSVQFSDKNNSNINTKDDKDWKYKLKGNGANIGIGLIGKF